MYKLICFPYAGGSAVYFSGLKEKLLPDIQVSAMEYPGHGQKREEKFARDFSTLTEMAVSFVAENINSGDAECRYSIFGYSMGSLLAYEVSKQLVNMKKPDNLFLASFQAPDIVHKDHYAINDEEDWLRFVNQYGGIEPRILTDPRFREIYLLPLINDFNMLCRYPSGIQEKTTDINIIALHSVSDIPAEDVERWKKFTTGKFRRIEIPGGHFFLRENQVRISEVIHTACMKN